MIYKILLFIGVICNVCAQLLLRFYMKQNPILEMKGTLLQKCMIFLNVYFIGAIASYGLGFLLYAIALSKMELNTAYPVASVASIVLILVFSIFCLSETATVWKIVGMGMCICGIILIFR